MDSFRKYLNEEISKDLSNAKSSYADELEAIGKYTKQIRECKDSSLKRILEHNLKEEKDHAKELKKWIDAQ